VTPPPFSRSAGVDADREAEEIERERNEAQLTDGELRLVRVMRAIAIEEVSHVRGSMLTKDDVAGAVTDGMRKLLHDDQVIEAFWKRGFDHMSRHGADGAQRWVGRRIWVAFISALFAAAIYLAAKLGTLK
jgi:hypothetical protein